MMMTLLLQMALALGLLGILTGALAVVLTVAGAVDRWRNQRSGKPLAR